MHWPTPSTSDNGADNASPGSGRRRSFWRSVGYLTSLGWMIALPIGVGVVVGRVLDDHLGTGSFWTLALLGAGVAVAALQLASAAYTALERISHE